VESIKCVAAFALTSGSVSSRSTTGTLKGRLLWTVENRLTGASVTAFASAFSRGSFSAPLCRTRLELVERGC